MKEKAEVREIKKKKCKKFKKKTKKKSWALERKRPNVFSETGRKKYVRYKYR